MRRNVRQHVIYVINTNQTSLTSGINIIRANDEVQSHNFAENNLFITGKKNYWKQSYFFHFKIT